MVFKNNFQRSRQETPVDDDSSDDDFQDASETLDSYDGAMYEAEEEETGISTRRFDPLSEYYNY